MFHWCPQAFWAPYQIHSRRCSQLLMCSLALVQHFMGWRLPEKLLSDKAGLRYSHLSLTEASEPNPGSGENLCWEQECFVEQMAGSWVFHQLQAAGKMVMELKCSFAWGWWWIALNAPPKLGFSVGFLGVQKVHTLFCRHGGSGLVEIFGSVIKSSLLWAQQARSVWSVLFCGENSSSNFTLLFLIFAFLELQALCFLFCTQTNRKPLDPLME